MTVLWTFGGQFGGQMADCTVLLNADTPQKCLLYRDFISAPDRIRTCDLRFRRPTLYPTELRAQLAEKEGFDPSFSASCARSSVG